MRLRTPVLLAIIALVPVVTSAQQDVPPPQPFPRPGSGSPARPAPPPSEPAVPAPTARPAPASAAPPSASGAPTDVSLGIPGIIYPTAEFLTAFDLERGQRCYLFGSNIGYAEMVAYYKQILKDGGRELTKAPAMQQFDLGKFQDQTMSTQPGVVVKDYTFGGSDGYLHVDGIDARRFRTIIQIVPPPSAR